MILTLTGASGAGKSTLAQALVRLLPSAELSPGWTTRAMRPSETPADVHPISAAEFADRHARDEFLWTVEVHGHWYGTLRETILSGLAARGHLMLLALTAEVLPTLQAFAAEHDLRSAMRSVYVLAPELAELRSRLVARESDAASLERRLADCLAWDRQASSAQLYDLLVPGHGDVELNARRVMDSLAMLDGN